MLSSDSKVCYHHKRFSLAVKSCPVIFSPLHFLTADLAEIHFNTIFTFITLSRKWPISMKFFIKVLYALIVLIDSV
jgi:hypothetical protein